MATVRHARGGSILISHAPTNGTTTRCLCCDEIVHAGQALQASSGLYHTNCFICNNCGLEITASTPYVEYGESFLAPYHPKCFQQWNEDRCAKCKQTITIGKTVLFEDVRYHKQCLVCAGCYGTLSDNAASVSGRPYCGLCAHKHVGGASTTFSVPVEGPKPDISQSIGANSQLYSLVNSRPSSTANTARDPVPDKAPSATSTPRTFKAPTASTTTATTTTTPAPAPAATATPAPASASASASTSAPAPTKRFCIECGTNVTGRNFCIECGKKV